MSEHTDILIVGGGLVGASLAIALDAAGCSATLVEAAAPRVDRQPSYDERNLALARATVNGLRELGVWAHVATAATAIRHIHVSRAGAFGSARLDAAASGVDALGWTLPARELGAGLLARLQGCSRLRRLAPARVTALQRVDDGWLAGIDEDGRERQLHARLLVGADGTASAVRTALGIASDDYDYQQQLFVSTITPERAPQGRAFERFTDAGPVALLPLANDRAGLVVTVAEDEAAAVAALDDDGYADYAQTRFGWRLGALRRPGRRFAYPIRRVAAHALTGARAVLVGNAAQTIHPIGAQGFNLGLRDALTLAELVATADDPGAAALLHDYAARRAPDRDGVMAMSHGLIRLACLPLPALAPLHTLALAAVDRIAPLRETVARRGMGFRGRPPRAVLEVEP